MSDSLNLNFANHPDLRVGYDERKDVTDILTAYMGRGFLSLVEYEQRARKAELARTGSELLELMADLPELPPQQQPQPVSMAPVAAPSMFTVKNLFIWVLYNLLVIIVLLAILDSAGVDSSRGHGTAISIAGYVIIATAYVIVCYARSQTVKHVNAILQSRSSSPTTRPSEAGHNIGIAP